MAQIAADVPELVLLRLHALAAVSGKTINDLMREALEALASAPSSRTAILKARRALATAAATPVSLADLGWVDHIYAGQTLDELISFEKTERPLAILHCLESAIQAKEKSNPLEISGVERIVLSILALNREVGNGGFHQFFNNSSKRFAPAIIDDLLHIGCPEMADITQRALDSLRLSELTASAIEKAMNRSPDPARDQILNRCDIAFDARKGLPEALLSYVKAHLSAIRVLNRVSA